MLFTNLTDKRSCRYLAILVGYMLLAAITVCGRQYVPGPDQQDAIQREKERKDLESNRAAERERQNPASSVAKDVSSNFERWNRENALRTSRSIPREEVKRIKALRAPNPDDSIKYMEFLKQRGTGLFRLFPDLGCEEKNLVRVDGDCEGIVPFSSAYSFRLKDYVNSDFIDIRFKDGNLITDGFLSQEIFVSLGDVPLENISLTSDGMKFLVDFKPETTLINAAGQFKEITKTIDSGGYKYGKKLRVDLNTTYAARIIAYRYSPQKIARQSPAADEKKFRDLAKKFWDLQNDKRVDLTIAFRVIRKDTDRDITIIWKELNQQKSPQIIFNKDENLADIK